MSHSHRFVPTLNRDPSNPLVGEKPSNPLVGEKRKGASPKIQLLALSLSLIVPLSTAQTQKVRYPLSKAEQQAYKEWKVYGGASDNVKFSALDQINTGNVKNLQVAWVYSSSEASSTNRTDMKVNPLIVDGVLYGLNPQLRLFALDGATGKVKWVYDPVEVPVKGKNIGRGDFAASTKISRGVAYYKGSETDQRIIYAPGGGHALYCIDARTGKLITSFVAAK